MTADFSSQSDLITQLRTRVEAVAESAVQERDGLKAERDQVVQERDGLKAERDQVVQERDGLKAERDRVMNALLHVFPYDYYSEARGDLADMSNEQQAVHFIHYGIHEGVSLEYSRLCERLHATHAEKSKTLVARLNELEALVSQYSARLSVVQDLFVRLSIEKREL